VSHSREQQIEIEKLGAGENMLAKEEVTDRQYYITKTFLTPSLIDFFWKYDKRIIFFISRLEYTHKNEITDMCSGDKYLIVLHKMLFI
jgi:hypothetical protein